MKHLISKAELARRAGVTAPAISRHFREGGKLHESLVGTKVDAGHPAVKSFLESKDVDPTSPSFQPPEHTESRGFPDDGSPQAIVDLQSLTLAEIVDRFGGLPEHAEAAKVGKLIEDWLAARLKNEETQGLLIRRELVSTHLIGWIDEANRRLLGDAPKTIARKMYAAAKSGMELEKAEAEVRDSISTVLSPMKTRVVKALRSSGPD